MKEQMQTEGGGWGDNSCKIKKQLIIYECGMVGNEIAKKNMYWNNFEQNKCHKMKLKDKII